MPPEMDNNRKKNGPPQSRVSAASRPPPKLVTAAAKKPAVMQAVKRQHASATGGKAPSGPSRQDGFDGIIDKSRGVKLDAQMAKAQARLAMLNEEPLDNEEFGGGVDEDEASQDDDVERVSGDEDEDDAISRSMPNPNKLCHRAWLVSLGCFKYPFSYLVYRS